MEVKTPKEITRTLTTLVELGRMAHTPYWKRMSHDQLHTVIIPNVLVRLFVSCLFICCCCCFLCSGWCHCDSSSVGRAGNCWYCHLGRSSHRENKNRLPRNKVVHRQLPGSFGEKSHRSYSDLQWKVLQFTRKVPFSVESLGVCQGFESRSSAGSDWSVEIYEL